MKLKNNIYIGKLIRDFFLIVFLLFIIFVLLEFFKPGMVVNYIRLDFYLLLLFASGIINIFFWQPQSKSISKLNFFDYSTIILLSLLTGIFIFWLTKGIGLLSGLIGFLSAIIFYFFIIFVYQND